MSVETLALLPGRLAPGRGRGLGEDRRPDLVGAHRDGLRQVERRLPGRRGDGDSRRAHRGLVGGEAPGLGTEHPRHRLSRPGPRRALPRRIARAEKLTAQPAAAPGQRVGAGAALQGLDEVGAVIGPLQDVLGAVRPLHRVLGTRGAGGDQDEPGEAEVLDHPRRGADVAGFFGAHEHESDQIEVHGPERVPEVAPSRPPRAWGRLTPPRPRHRSPGGSRGRHEPEGVPMSANRLAGEKSPYLLQHAHNPVDWYPWGDEAFAKARTEDKPIFLSIGYSTCHWCHVMERESFENAEIAAILNERFVPVKVDREERPDVDGQYMTAVQGLVGSGGWPLTVVLTPELKPFFGGTYFPPEERLGRPGLRSILLQLHEAWSTSREQVEFSAQTVAEFVRSRVPANPAKLGPRTLHQGWQMLRTDYDEANGGFGGAPKFPRPHTLSLSAAPERSRARHGAAPPGRAPAGRDGGGGHSRSPRRGIRALLHRRAVARAPLREDALRPGAVGPRLSGDVSGHAAASVTPTSPATSSPTCCAICAGPRGRSSPPRTRTARGRRGGSTSGSPTRCRSFWAPRRTRSSPPPTGSRCAATSRGGGRCSPACRTTRRWPRSSASRRARCEPASPRRDARSSRRGRSACARIATTRCWPTGTGS